MNILISNIYSYKNKGDATIVISSLDGLQKRYPNAKFILSTDDPNDIDLYGKFDIVPSFNKMINKVWFSKDIFNNLFILFYTILLKGVYFLEKITTYLNIDLKWLYPYSLKFKIESYKNSDLIFAIGGGYLLTSTKLRLLDRLFGRPSIHLSCLEFFFAKAYNKPVILLHQSIGPFFHRDDLKTVLRYIKKVELIITREKISFDLLQGHGINNVLLKPDLAFAFFKEGQNYLPVEKSTEPSRNVGITVRAYLTPKEQKIYENEISKFLIKYLETNHNSFIYFIPQVIYSERNDDDSIVSQRIFSSLNDELKSRCFCINQDLSPHDLRTTIGECNLFIGTRMHSNIFSLSKLVKTIAIAYEPKTQGIMQMLGLQDYCINIQELTAELLESKIDILQNDNNYYSNLKSKLQEIRSEIWDFDERLFL